MIEKSNEIKKTNLVNWNILLAKGKKINRDVMSSGERNLFKCQITFNKKLV